MSNHTLKSVEKVIFHANNEERMQCLFGVMPLQRRQRR